MVERNWKSLKDLFRQREHPKGSILEGYMVYQTTVYITQYSPKLTTNINHEERISDAKSNQIFEGEHLLGKGRMRKVRCK